MFLNSEKITNMDQVQWYENLFYQSNLGFDGKIYKGMEKVLRFCCLFSFVGGVDKSTE